MSKLPESREKTQRNPLSRVFAKPIVLMTLIFMHINGIVYLAKRKFFFHSSFGHTQQIIAADNSFFFGGPPFSYVQLINFRSIHAREIKYVQHACKADRHGDLCFDAQTQVTIVGG